MFYTCGRTLRWTRWSINTRGCRDRGPFGLYPSHSVLFFLGHYSPRATNSCLRLLYAPSGAGFVSSQQHLTLLMYHHRILLLVLHTSFCDSLLLDFFLTLTCCILQCRVRNQCFIAHGLVNPNIVHTNTTQPRVDVPVFVLSVPVPCWTF
jgi:membrane-associated PAP2 superfamily phosphatase